MNRKNILFFCIILLAGLVWIGNAKAASLEAMKQPAQVMAGNPPSGFSQIPMHTATPQHIDPAELARPVRSEAGRNVGIIVGAGGLVLVVVFGIVWGLKRQSQTKAGD
jgi:hypothetical protein